MKRVLCPKCDNYITFDETKYTEGQSLVFVCDHCKKQFSIRIGKSKLKATRKEEILDEQDPSMDRRHCIINVKRNKQGEVIYTLRDNDSITGTFLMNEILGNKDRIRIEEGAIITLGATTLILRATEK